MLVFDARFEPDDVVNGLLGCVLWADEPKLGRVRFHVGRGILSDVLHGANPVHHNENARLCEASRPRIEKACRRAFARDQSVRFELSFIDFR